MPSTQQRLMKMFFMGIVLTKLHNKNSNSIFNNK